MGSPVRGSTFYRFLSGAWRAVTQTSAPFDRYRLQGTATIADVVRQFNLFVAGVADATLGSRSLPFGGPLSYYEAYPFKNATAATIPHGLKTDRVRVWLGHKLQAGDVTVVAVGVDSVTLLPSADFIADVLFLVAP